MIKENSRLKVAMYALVSAEENEPNKPLNASWNMTAVVFFTAQQRTKHHQAQTWSLNI